MTREEQAIQNAAAVYFHWRAVGQKIIYRYEA